MSDFLRRTPQAPASPPTPNRPTAAPAVPTGPAPSPLPAPPEAWFAPWPCWPEGPDLVEQARHGDPDPIQAALDEVTDPCVVESRAWIIGDQLMDAPVVDLWVQRHGDRSAVPWLVAAAGHISRAWEIRGGGRASTVAEDAWPRFQACAREAEKVAWRGAAAHPTSPLPWTGLLMSGRALSISRPELDARWLRASGPAGPLPAATNAHTQNLCRKWFGSDDEVFAFARQLSADAPEGSWLHRFVFDAWYEVSADKDDAERTALRRSDEAREELKAAARRCLLHAPGWTQAHELGALNQMAMVCRLFGLDDLARRCHELIGDRYTGSPWSWWNDPTAIVRSARAQYGLPAR